MKEQESKGKQIPRNNFLNKTSAWLTIIRIQFYPMAWIAYTLGALLANSLTGRFDKNVYWTGYILLFLIELVTILFNEYFDFNADCLNKNFSMFTGGTRMLVKSRLSFGEVKTAIGILFCFIIILLYQLLILENISTLAFLLLGSELFLGIGYTTPPVQFCYKGLGELVVCLTHSPLVILSGFVLQGGSLVDPLPWLYSIPLFFAIFAAIILAGIPDRSSDEVVSKKTLAVILGSRRATLLSFLSILIAAVSGLLMLLFGLVDGLAGILFLLIIPHAIILWTSLYKLIKTNHYDRQINKIMNLALLYIIWFGIIPLLYYYWKT